MHGPIRHTGADRDDAVHRHRAGDDAPARPAPRGLVAVMILCMVCLAGATARTEPITAHDIYVLDGHTVDREGQPIVLMGFDVPNVDHPQCASERALAARTAARLRQIVGRGSSLDLQMVACACPEGTEGTPACNKGALCGRLIVDLRDVGDMLVGENLAQVYVCSQHSCPRRPSWCP